MQPRRHRTGDSMMMMDNLLSSRSACFFRLKGPLPASTVARTLMACTLRAVGPVDMQVRVARPVDDALAHCSFALFKVKSTPPFLRTSALHDVRHGFLFLIEVDGHLCIMRRLAGDP